MRFRHTVTEGTGDPSIVSVPPHLADIASLDIGQDVSAVLAGDTTGVGIEDKLGRSEDVGLPPARELLLKPQGPEVPAYA